MSYPQQPYPPFPQPQHSLRPAPAPKGGKAKHIIGYTATALVALAIGAAAGGSAGEAPAVDASDTTTSTRAAKPPKPASISDGTHVVGVDIKAGTYRTAGSGVDGLPCYWARLKNTDGELDSVLANGTPTGPTTVTIRKTDKAFETTGCKAWRKV